MIRYLRRLSDSRYAWIVVAASFLMLVLGNGALFLLVVSMKDIAASFGWPRSVPSFAYSLQFIGGGVGGIVMGWWLDRAGMGWPALVGAVMIGTGAVLVSMAANEWEFYLVYGLVIGLLGQAALYVPLVANATRWFVRRRGIAVGLVTSGQSVAGALWPPLFECGLATWGWRDTYLFYGVASMAVMVPLSLLLRRSPRALAPSGTSADAIVPGQGPSPVGPRAMMVLLCIAIVGCCVSMSLPIAHIKSHATDVGIAPMEAASVLSVLLAASFVSRALVCGLMIEWIGALKTLFVFSFIQTATLGLLPFLEGSASLMITAAIFGLGFGGIAPTYPVIIRENLPAQWTGRCTGIVVLFGTLGMAIGGWIGGIGFDVTGSYHTPFLAGVAFNAINLVVIGYLIAALRPSPPVMVPAH